MIEDKFTGYVLVAIKVDDREQLKQLKPYLNVLIDYKDLPSKEYLLASFHHFLDTEYLKENWIRDDVLRFLAFIYRESQISEIMERVNNIRDPVAILVLEKKSYMNTVKNRFREIQLRSSLENLEELALFRITIEKERGKI